MVLDLSRWYEMRCYYFLPTQGRRDVFPVGLVPDEIKSNAYKIPNNWENLKTPKYQLPVGSRGSIYIC